MLKIVVPEREFYDEIKNEFITVQECELLLEHSLVSISKWESLHHVPFLGKKNKTEADIRSYVECMTLNTKVDPNVYASLTEENFNEISKYISDSMTATTITDTKNKNSNEIITSELIYYAMISFNIPFECQKWHINRLLTLIRVCGEKNKDPKKMSKSEIYSRNRALNEARKKSLHTRG